MSSHGEPLRARVAIGFDGPEPPTEIMFMPAGEHELTASRAGRAVTVRVQVDRSAAAALQESLQKHLAASAQRPYFDFDHKDEAASAWPLGFFWKETPAPGIYARVEWSGAGADAIRGKTHRAFSPTFYDAANGKSAARVVGAPLNMGGLVNNPAFKSILPLWAKQHEHTMENTNNSEADTATLENENQELRAALSAHRKKDAERAVRAAVKRGVIPPQNAAMQAKWVERIERNPEDAEMLAGLPGNSALGGSMITAPIPNRHGSAQITGEDIAHVCQGYLNAKAESPWDAGVIYRREIDPILAKGERIPFERLKKLTALGGTSPIMATNTLGTLVGNIISQRALALIVSRRPMLVDIVTDFTAEKVRLNQTVYTRTIGLPTVQNFGGTTSDTADTDYPVTMNLHKEVRFTYAATEYLGTGRNLVKEHAESQAMAIGNYMVDQVAALITAAFTSVQTAAANTKDYSSIVASTKAINAAGAGAGRAGWVNADVAEALRNDELIMAHFDRNGEAYARWLNLEGFKEVIEYPALPTNSINLIAFFFHQNALLIASRLAIDTEVFSTIPYAGILESIQDPVTGLAVTNNLWIAQDTLAINQRTIILFGCARGAVALGQRWVSA